MEKRLIKVLAIFKADHKERITQKSGQKTCFKNLQGNMKEG